MNSVFLTGLVKGDGKLNNEVLSFILSVEERTKKGEAWESHFVDLPVAVTGKRTAKLVEFIKDGGRLVVEGKIAIGKGPYVLAKDVVLAGRKKDSGTGAPPSGDDIPF